MVAYPRDSGNEIIIGWHWRPQDMDIKAYAAIRDRARKESIMRALKGECLARNLTFGVEPDIYNFKRMAISSTIPVNDLTKDRFRNTVLNLMYMWGFLMSQFEGHNMSGAGFNPYDYI